MTKIVDPEPSPGVPVLFEQLEAAYRTLIQLEQPTAAEAQRLLSIVADLRWYADRIGAGRWDQLPRSNKWGFAQNLWRLTKQARIGSALVPNRFHYFIDDGKRCVGLASEAVLLFEQSQAN